MIILPAIDLMGGQVVRLQQGKADQKTVYSDDPVSFAVKWQQEGADYLHIVDLDGAFTGSPQNLKHIKAICSALSIPCELGGGMRTMRDLHAAFDAGITRAIIGSKACESLDFIRQAVAEFGGDRIAIGIDAKDGRVATRGWVDLSEWDALDLARTVAGLGVGTLIYTDISTDGMMQGPNITAQQTMLATVPDVRLIASGGVSKADDIRELNTLDGLYGVIVGKALYDHQLTLQECLSITR